MRICLVFNFARTSKVYRERVFYEVDHLLSKMVEDHLLKGGQFDAQKFTKMFTLAVRTAQLFVDLAIGMGLDPLPEEKDEDDKNSDATDTKDSSPASTEVVPFLVPGQATDQHDEVGNLRSGNPKGPSGRLGNAGRVRNPNRAADQVDDNGPARGGEINPPQQQPVPPEPGPGEGRGYSSGPQGTPVYPFTGN